MIIFNFLQDIRLKVPKYVFREKSTFLVNGV